MLHKVVLRDYSLFIALGGGGRGGGGGGRVGEFFEGRLRVSEGTEEGSVMLTER